MNTLSEIEEYYKAREQQLLEKLHQQEAASAAMPDGYPSCPECLTDIQAALKEELQQHN